MKAIIKKVLELCAARQLSISSATDREVISENIYREVGNFFQWWGKKPDIRYTDDHKVV